MSYLNELILNGKKRRRKKEEAQNILYLLRKLRSFGAKMETLKVCSTIASLSLPTSFLSWDDNLSLKYLNKLRRIVHLCEKTVGMHICSLDTMLNDSLSLLST